MTVNIPITDYNLNYNAASKAIIHMAIWQHQMTTQMKARITNQDNRHGNDPDDITDYNPYDNLDDKERYQPRRQRQKTT
jgi:hypothetical protein